MNKAAGIDTASSQSIITYNEYRDFMAKHARMPIDDSMRETIQKIRYVNSFPIRTYSESGFAYNKYICAGELFDGYLKRRKERIDEVKCALVVVRKVVVLIIDAKERKGNTYYRTVSSKLEQDNTIRELAKELEKRGYKRTDGELGGAFVRYTKNGARYQTVHMNTYDIQEEQRRNEEFITDMLNIVDEKG